MPFTVGLTPPILRADLEYPTENVSLLYLDAIGKATMGRYGQTIGLLTLDSFTDKKILGAFNTDGDADIATARWNNANNAYFNVIAPSLSTSDHQIYRVVNGSYAVIASEGVDLSYDVVWYGYLQAIGSSLTSGRITAEPVEDIFSVTFRTISCTDTYLASGKYGFAIFRKATTQGSGLSYLQAPATPKPPVKGIVEAEVIGSGSIDDPFRPNMARSLKEALQVARLPDFLHREAKKYEILKAKGFTDEEIEALLGYIPKRQVDLASITWGAFDHKKECNTMLIMIIEDNPYQAGAIEKQKEHAVNKGLKVLSPPRDYLEAVEQYRKLRADYPYWIAGKDSYAYQSLGHEALELLQVADLYYGELLEHKTHYSQLKRVPDWEMDRTLNRWRDRLQKVDVLHEERDKHLKKLTEVLKKGW